MAGPAIQALRCFEWNLGARNPKPEARTPKQVRNPKPETRTRAPGRVCALEFHPVGWLGGTRTTRPQPAPTLGAGAVRASGFGLVSEFGLRLSVLAPLPLHSKQRGATFVTPLYDTEIPCENRPWLPTAGLEIAGADQRRRLAGRICRENPPPTVGAQTRKRICKQALSPN